MPRLHGYAETTKLNIYDAIFDGLTANFFGAPNDSPFPGDITDLRSGRRCLFGNYHIGYAELTNTQVAGQTHSDQTAYVQNWYARTNIPACQELEAFAQSTTAELIVGCRPQLKQPLSDLLRRPQDTPLPLSLESPESAELAMMNVARGIYRTYADAIDPPTSNKALSDLPKDQILAWKAVAARMLRDTNNARMILLPPRQSFVVEVAPNRDAFEALVAATAKMEIAPRPRMWVHLQGFERRDVC